MKVKIKGLVFVGFAAAVLAQGANADDNPDAKTVTSKVYVDGKVQGVQETGSGNNIEYGNSNIASTSPNDKAPSSLNVYKFVTSQITANAVTVQDDSAGYVDVQSSNGTYTVGLEQTPVLAADATSGLIGTLTGTAPTKLVTAGAVNALIDNSISGTETNNTVPTSLAVQTYAEATSNKLAAGNTTGGTIGSNASDDTKFPTVKNVVEYSEKLANKAQSISAGTGGNSTDTNKYPTTKAVYDFVTTGGHYQPKVSTSGKFQVGYKETSDGTVGWKTLQEDDTADRIKYVKMTQKPGTGNENIYNINIPSSLISESNTDALTPANAAKLVTAGAVQALVDEQGDNVGSTITGTSSDTVVPTSKNVYNFVTGQISNAAGNYQPKINDTSYDKVMIGYNKRSGAEGSYTYESNWQELGAGTYVQATSNGTATTIDIKSAQLGTAIGDITDSSTKLLEGKAVYSLLQQYGSGSASTITSANATGTNGDKKVPTVKNVYNFVTERELTLSSASGNPETISTNSNVDNKVPTVANVYKFVTGQMGGLTIPVPTGDCAYDANGITSSNGVACALVLAYNGDSNNPGLALTWIPMAQ